MESEHTRRPPLTELAAVNAKARDGRYEIPDGKREGLFLVVQPSGTKSWAYRYRRPNGKPAKLTLGTFNESAFGVREARKAAAKAARSREEGRDPAVEKREAKTKARDTSDLTEVWLDKFADQYARAKRLRTADRTAATIEKRIKPAWTGRKVGEITPDDVHDLLDSVAKPIAKNRTLALVRKFFNWVLARKRSPIRVSPAAGIEAPADEKSRDRVLSKEDVRLLWRASDGSAHLARMVRLLLLTGQRRNEVAAMRWVELKLDGTEPTWTIPRDRAKNEEPHEVPLAPAVVEILRSVGQTDNSKFVLSTTGDSPISGFSNFKEALDRRMLAEARRENSAATIEPWRFHDLRRTVSTMMAEELDIAPHIIESLLNHKTGHKSGVAGIYNRAKYRPQVRAALNAWADYVSAVVTGETAASNIVQFRAG